MKKTKAFTLAEVLITLGIIGIVAAMTIPTLVNKVQNQEYVSALKKFYTTQLDGWSRILADEGVNSLDDTSLFQAIGNTSTCPIFLYDSDANCKAFFDDLQKYFKFKIISLDSNYKLYRLNGNPSGNAYYGMMTPDGMIISTGNFREKAAPYTTSSPSAAVVKSLGGHITSLIGYVEVDVNGYKKPNTYGRDIFCFLISNDGKLYPEKSKDTSMLEVGGSYAGIYWKNDPSACGSGTDLSSAYGNGCAARIMDEGWQMTY